MRYKNNPCNIRWSSRNDWRGQIEPKNGFCQFCELEYGVRATLRLVDNYRKNGFLTIGQIIKRFAPPKENATSAYIDYIVGRFNNEMYHEGFLFEEFNKPLYNADSLLTCLKEYVFLVRFMAFIESRTVLENFYISNIVFKYNLFKDLWKK